MTAINRSTGVPGQGPFWFQQTPIGLRPAQPQCVRYLSNTRFPPLPAENTCQLVEYYSYLLPAGLNRARPQLLFLERCDVTSVVWDRLVKWSQRQAHWPQQLLLSTDKYMFTSLMLISILKSWHVLSTLQVLSKHCGMIYK